MSENLVKETSLAVESARTSDPRNQLNDLSTTEWVARTISVMVQKGLGKESKEAFYEKLHPAPFSFQDVSRFVEFFTKAGQTVLDPFAGVGSALKASALLGRHSLGVELNPRFAELARERLDVELPADVLARVNCDVLEGDIRDVSPLIPSESTHLIVTSPPYWGILNTVDHKAKQERISKNLAHNYGDDVRDLASITNYEEFVEELARIFGELADKLAPKKYAVIVVSDFRQKDRYFMFHSDLASALEKSGRYRTKGVTVLYQKFKRVFPYGYPYAYVPNMHHQYALVMQRSS